MSNKAMKLVEALGLDLKSLPRLMSLPFQKELQREFSQKHPSRVSKKPKGYAEVPSAIPRRTRLALARQGIEFVGMLELLSDDDIMKRRPSGKQTDLGVATRDRVQNFLQQQGKQLRSPSTSYAEVAKASFGSAALVPIEWLIFEEALTLLECKDLPEWGIRCLGDICNIPQGFLLLLPTLDESKLRKVRRTVEKLGLSLK